MVLFYGVIKVNRETLMVEEKLNGMKLMKRINIWFSILEISKLLMYAFHYNCLRKLFGCQAKLCDRDADSFRLAISRPLSTRVHHIAKQSENLFDLATNHWIIQTIPDWTRRLLGRWRMRWRGKRWKGLLVCMLNFVGLRCQLFHPCWIAALSLHSLNNDMSLRNMCLSGCVMVWVEHTIE